jgi:uncharacterized membrane protein YfcA
MKVRLPPPLDLMTILVAVVWLGFIAKFLISNTIDKELFGTISGLFGTLIGYQVSAKKKPKDDDDDPPVPPAPHAVLVSPEPPAHGGT